MYIRKSSWNVFCDQVAKLFQEQLQPLVEWLSSAERQVKALELVPTDEEKIQQKIREHKVWNTLNAMILS